MSLGHLAPQSQCLLFFAECGERFGKRQEPPRPQGGDSGLPSFMRPEQGILMLKADQAKIAGYFNIDNGTGKLRGIYTQENAQVAPIFAAWGEPFRPKGLERSGGCCRVPPGDPRGDRRAAVGGRDRDGVGGGSPGGGARLRSWPSRGGRVPTRPSFHGKLPSSGLAAAA